MNIPNWWTLCELTSRIKTRRDEFTQSADPKDTPPSSPTSFTTIMVRSQTPTSISTQCKPEFLESWINFECFWQCNYSLIIKTILKKIENNDFTDTEFLKNALPSSNQWEMSSLWVLKLKRLLLVNRSCS